MINGERTLGRAPIGRPLTLAALPRHHDILKSGIRAGRPRMRTVMARSSTDLPRMDNQPRPRRAAARETPRVVPGVPSVPGASAAQKPMKQPMMRQYELVE